MTTKDDVCDVYDADTTLEELNKEFARRLKVFQEAMKDV